MRLGKESKNGRRLRSDARSMHVSFVTRVSVSSSGAFVVDVRGEATSRRIDPVGTSAAAAQLTDSLQHKLAINGGT